MGTDHGPQRRDSCGQSTVKYTNGVYRTRLQHIPVYTFEVSVKASSSIGLHINEVEFVGAQVKPFVVSGASVALSGETLAKS